MSVYIHESSIIDQNVILQDGVKIWHFSHILSGSTLGEKTVVGQNCMIGPDVIVGNGCKIQNNVSLYKGVELEEGVFCGPSCVFTNVINPRAFIERKDEFRKTLVKKGASIGANATILCGITVGAYALIGAGAVVNKDVKDFELILGIPGRHAGWVCKCGVTLSKASSGLITCQKCSSKYELKDATLFCLAT